jgi:hypothetical protein
MCLYCLNNIALQVDYNLKSCVTGKRSETNERKNKIKPAHRIAFVCSIRVITTMDVAFLSGYFNGKPRDCVIVSLRKIEIAM